MNEQIAKLTPHEWTNESMNEQIGLRQVPEKLLLFNYLG